MAELNRQAKFFEVESINWKRIADEGSQRLQKLEKENDELESRMEHSIATDPSRDNDWKVVRDELTRQASYLKTLESSNLRMSAELTQLRLRNESIKVLTEQKHDLARKLERELTNTDVLRQSVAKLEVEVEAARKEMEEWCTTSLSLARPLLIPISKRIKGEHIRASCAHSRICDPQSRQPAARTWACIGGVRNPQSCSAAEGAGDTGSDRPR